MSRFEIIGEAGWYEAIRLGEGITLIHEPWIKPFFRCNIWHVRGRDRDLLFDSGLGHFSLRRALRGLAEREPLCVASHTHFDHIGCHHEFSQRCVHAAEAAVLADPRPALTFADRYADEQMFDALPAGWNTQTYTVRPAPAQTILQAGQVIDLGDRVFEVIHTPGHSPGGIALWEAATGVLLSGDIIYDGPLIDDSEQADLADYLDSLAKLARLPVNVVHGGHFPSFGRVRLRQLIEEYRNRRHAPGCHLAPPLG